RRAQLAELARRKDELRGQLRQVEAEIQAVKQGTPAEQAAVAASAPPSQPGKPLKLPALLVEMVRAAGRPVTVAELAAELVRRKFPTTSGDLPRMIATRVRELVDKGVFRRAPGQPGVVAGPPSASAKKRAAAPRTGQPKKGSAASTSRATNNPAAFSNQRS